MNWLQQRSARKKIERQFYSTGARIHFPQYSSLECQTSDYMTESASCYDIPRSVRFAVFADGWMAHVNYLTDEAKTVTYKIAPDVWCVEGKHSHHLHQIISITPHITVKEALMHWMQIPRRKVNAFHYMALTQAVLQIQQVQPKKNKGLLKG